jgi:hypothetical protein
MKPLPAKLLSLSTLAVPERLAYFVDRTPRTFPSDPETRAAPGIPRLAHPVGVG